jgi:type I restriction enzyme S subunit
VNIITPDNWKVEPLCHVTDVIMGQSPASKYYNFEGEGLPFFQGKTEFGELYPVARKWCSKPNKIAKNNDVLISVRAPVGPTNIANQECCIGRGLAAVRTLDGLPHKYILYFLRSIEQQIESLGTGTTFKAISGQTLRNLSVPIAPPEQQKQIVEEIEKQFSRLDKAIADLKRVKANLKRYKASVLQAAVTGKLTEAWRKQNPNVEPASKLLERILTERRQKWEEAELAKMTAKGKIPKNDKWKEKYKEPAAPDTSNLPELPDGWVRVTVEQIASVGTGATPLRSNKAYYDEGTVPWVTSGALNDLFVKESKEFITELALKETNVKLFPKHSLLIAMYGEGKTRGKASELIIEAGTNQACAALVFEGKQKAIQPYAKLFFLKNYNDIRMLSSGGVQPNLNLGIIKSTLVPLPPKEEQVAVTQEVENRLSVAEELEHTVDNNLKRAERLRQSILKQAFSGKLI